MKKKPKVETVQVPNTDIVLYKFHAEYEAKEFLDKKFAGVDVIWLGSGFYIVENVEEEYQCILATEWIDRYMRRINTTLRIVNSVSAELNKNFKEE